MNRAEAHGIKLALTEIGVSDEASLPDEHARATDERIFGDCEELNAQRLGWSVLPTVWKESTEGDPFACSKLWGSALPSLQAVAIKVMKMPAGFSAGERSFSNAASIQTRLRMKHSWP